MENGMETKLCWAGGDGMEVLWAEMGGNRSETGQGQLGNEVCMER